MQIQKEMAEQGNWLFRRRGILPFLILPLLLIALPSSEILERIAGEAANDIWEVVCFFVSLTGLAIRCIAVGSAPERTSGRNTQKQLAQTLNTTGMYSLVRHPLYLGNYVIFLGFVLETEVWWLVLVATLAFWIYYERIMMAEEVFLHEQFGDEYIQWAQKTPAFFPAFGNWTKPALSFSWRHVLRREYTAFFLICLTFPALDFIEDLATDGAIKLDAGWLAVLAVGTITYLSLMTLKKKTMLLHVKGR